MASECVRVRVGVRERRGFLRSHRGGRVEPIVLKAIRNVPMARRPDRLASRPGLSAPPLGALSEHPAPAREPAGSLPRNPPVFTPGLQVRHYLWVSLGRATLSPISPCALRCSGPSETRVNPPLSVAIIHYSSQLSSYSSGLFLQSRREARRCHSLQTSLDRTQPC